MLKEGLVDEVKLNKNKVKNCNIENAIGYNEIIYYLQGKTSLKEVSEKIIKKTINFSKRQNTWFKNRFKADIDFKIKDNFSLIVESFKKIN